MQFDIGVEQVKWTQENLIDALEEFSELYKQRPVANNDGGMASNHMFYTWFAMRNLKPQAIIESGVRRGQSTWLLEQACPDAKIYCIDIDYSLLEYRSKSAKYYDRDFSTIDWNDLPKDNTVIFFDDHQNAYERLKTAKWFGFKHIVFEDNYVASRGDFYTLKMIFMRAGYSISSTKELWSLNNRIKWQIRKYVDKILKMRSSLFDEILPNATDLEYLKSNLDIYYEFPPIFKPDISRWGDTIDDERFPSKDPLYKAVEKDYLQVYKDDSKEYNWLCYVKLKQCGSKKVNANI